jgi:hypothetical protein
VHIVQFYKKMYTEQLSWRSLLNDLSFDYISEAKGNCLEREFEEGEVL